jgi:hypothetical protein
MKRKFHGLNLYSYIFYRHLENTIILTWKILILASFSMILDSDLGFQNRFSGKCTRFFWVANPSAFDRYLAVARYEKYKKSVSNRGVVLVLLVAFTLTFAVVTSPFWTGFRSLNTCTINLTQMHWVFVLNFFLGIVCVISPRYYLR